MVQIYGQSGVENALLQECPSEINCFDDIKPLSVKYKNDLEQAKKIFFEKLPTVIQIEKEKLEELKNNRETMEYTKESLIEDLEYKKADLQEFMEGLDWIIEHYKKGVLP